MNVPDEPTKEMLDAMINAFANRKAQDALMTVYLQQKSDKDVRRFKMGVRYKAMLDFIRGG